MWGITATISVSLCITSHCNKMTWPCKDQPVLSDLLPFQLCLFPSTSFFESPCFLFICCLPALINHTLNLHLSVPRLTYLPTWLNVASLLRRGSIEIPVDVSDAGNKTSGGCITGTTSRAVWDTANALASPFSSIYHSCKDALTVRTWWRKWGGQGEGGHLTGS